MISCTSPSDSAYGLPTSWVTSRESASLLASTSRPTWAITRPRAGAGTAAHPGCAARAARQASSKVWASPSSTSATTSSVRAGFVEVRRPPGASSRWVPSTMEAMVRDMPANLSRPSARGEPGLEPVDRRGVDGVGAAEHREVEGDEVAEQDERHEALDARLPARRDPLDRRRPARHDVRGQRHPPGAALARLGVLEEDGGEAAEPPGGR